jgi:hypothetical protein
MADQPRQPEVVDPDCVPEIICDGQFNVSITGNLAMLTFTHVRPDPTIMFRDGRIEPKSIVRARIVMTLPNLAALRAEPGYPGSRYPRSTRRRFYTSLACVEASTDASHKLLTAAQTKWNFLPFTPGLVGGHCIGVDPYYLTHRAEKVGYHPEVILAGRRINDGVGERVARECVRRMLRNGSPRWSLYSV